MGADAVYKVLDHNPVKIIWVGCLAPFFDPRGDLTLFSFFDCPLSVSSTTRNTPVFSINQDHNNL